MFSHIVSAARELLGVDSSSMFEISKGEQATSASVSDSTVDISEVASRSHSEEFDDQLKISCSRLQAKHKLSTTQPFACGKQSGSDQRAAVRTDRMNKKSRGRENQSHDILKTKKRQQKEHKRYDSQSSKLSRLSTSMEIEPTSSAYVRFGSEEPETQPTQENEKEEPQQQDQDSVAEHGDEYESSDDEAPEAVSKDAALEKLKEASRKELEAKKRVDEQRRERRRERDRRLKSQAIRKVIEVPSEKDQTSDSEDDFNGHSTSSSTYHGSTSNAHFRASLPALLPDDILNSEPAPLNTPAALALDMEQDGENGAITKPTKRRFLDDYEKEQKKYKTKVVKKGGNTYVVSDIRQTTLPPRANKSSNNIKQRWLSRDRKGMAGATSLRRTAPQVGGFIRR